MKNPNSGETTPNSNHKGNGIVVAPGSVSAGGAGVIEECSNCGTKNGWVLHNVRFRATLRRFCTSCVLRLHPAYFCPFCFVFRDHHNSKNTPPPNLLVSCSKCPSLSHSDCLPRPHEAAAAAFLCPPCASANPSYSFFQLDDHNKVLDKRLAAVLLCAANIAAASMSKAVVTSRAEAEQRVREAAFARKRAREALDRLVLLSNLGKSKTTPIAFNNGGLDHKQQLVKGEDDHKVKLELKG